MSNNQYEPELQNKLHASIWKGGRRKALMKNSILGKVQYLTGYNSDAKNAKQIQQIQEENASYEEVKQLRKELAEAQKENAFLKKAAAFFAKEINYRSTSSSRNVIRNLVQDCFSKDLTSIRLLITIT